MKELEFRYCCIKLAKTIIDVKLESIKDKNKRYFSYEMRLWLKYLNEIDNIEKYTNIPNKKIVSETIYENNFLLYLTTYSEFFKEIYSFFKRKEYYQMKVKIFDLYKKKYGNYALPLY